MPEPAEPEAALRAAVLEQLDLIKDPCSVAGGTPMGLTELGLVESVEISAAVDVTVNLRLTSPFCHMIAFMKSEAVSKVGALPGVGDVTVTADKGLDWSPSMIAAPAQRRRQERLSAMPRREPLREEADR